MCYRLPLCKQRDMYRRRYYKVCKENKHLNKQFAKHTDSKTVEGRVAEEWICRVIACAPHASSRALQYALNLATTSV